MAKDRLINHTQGEQIITLLTSIATSLSTISETLTAATVSYVPVPEPEPEGGEEEEPNAGT